MEIKMPAGLLEGLAKARKAAADAREEREEATKKWSTAYGKQMKLEDEVREALHTQVDAALEDVVKEGAKTPKRKTKGAA